MIDKKSYKRVAENLRKEEKLVSATITNCAARYAYTPACVAMREGAAAIDLLLNSILNSSHPLPINALLIGPEEFLTALLRETDMLSLPLYQIDAFAQFVKCQYAMGRAFSEYEVVGLDIEQHAVVRAVRRSPDRFSMLGTEIALTHAPCPPTNPELTKMSREFLKKYFA